MPKKGGEERARPVTEQILVEAARIYDARDDEAVESKDLKTYAEFLAKEDAFVKVCAGAAGRGLRRKKGSKRDKVDVSFMWSPLPRFQQHFLHDELFLSAASEGRNCMCMSADARTQV